MALIEINRHPSSGEIRWFGLLLALFFALIGSLARWRLEAPVAARWIWIIGAALVVVYYGVPVCRRWMYVGWMYLAFPIGWVVSHILLGVVFYLVLTPIGLIMRLGGRDPLQRRFEPEARSYWIEHRPDGDPDRYFRQY